MLEKTGKFRRGFKQIVKLNINPFKSGFQLVYFLGKTLEIQFCLSERDGSLKCGEHKSESRYEAVLLVNNRENHGPLQVDKIAMAMEGLMEVGAYL